MSTRILLAGILGGIVMFIWSFIGHDLLPLGKAGVHEIPNEDAVTSALQSNIGDHAGFYFFPGPGVGPDATRQQREETMKKAMEKMATAPSGVLIYHPPGRTFNFAKALGIESRPSSLKPSCSYFSSPNPESAVSPAESASFLLGD
jgi:hypothetical protein